MFARRLSAFFLLLTLVGGGLGLPVADAAIYHATPTERAPLTDRASAGAPTTTPHFQGCVLTLSGLTGASLAGTAPVVEVATASLVTASFATLPTVLTQTDLALGQSRAPPVA